MLTGELRIPGGKKWHRKKRKNPHWFVDRGLAAVTVNHSSLALNQCHLPNKSLCSPDEKQSRGTPS